ncbi:hypothetical protein [Kribbia dieselivorans]|uniref:hypothetical protein n=1 Tax=Kribbia dieselivorans TaxID=331526 RepID=UPI0008385E66|nr:hypothetical protein [Kribbia dieselivorans]
MALITLFSAAGAPGTTVTALGLALAWPRPVVLVDADATGASTIMAGFLRGQTAYDRGLLDLAMAARVGTLNTAIATTTLTLPGSTVEFLPGIRGHQQAPSVAGLWEPLSGVLRSLEQQGTDVIVDCGRLSTVGAPLPLVRASDLALLCTRTTLPDIAGARSWARSLVDEFADMGAADRFGLALVDEGNPYTAREIRKALGAPTFLSLPWDPQAAGVYHHAAERRGKLSASKLGRALTAGANSLVQDIARNRAKLGTNLSQEGRQHV